MKPFSTFCGRKKFRAARFATTGFLFACLLLCIQANAKFQFNGGDSSNPITSEKKIDYLEQIYFSGSDKDELDRNILIAIQEMQTKVATPSLVKQATFLLEVQPKISETGSACDALDLLAVGIYNIDAAEATRQGVKMPSNKAKEKSVDAVAALNKLSNSAYNTSSNASNLMWSSIIYSNGKYTSVAAKAGKVASIANGIGGVANTMGKIGQTGQQAAGVLKGFGVNIGGNKKKACNNVPQKEIALGEHASITDVSKVINTSTSATTNTPVIAAPVPHTETPPTNKNTITIKAINSIQLKSLLSAIGKIPGVTTAESDSFDKNTAIVMVACEMKAAELADKNSGSK